MKLSINLYWSKSHPLILIKDTRTLKHIEQSNCGRTLGFLRKYSIGLEFLYQIQEQSTSTNLYFYKLQSTTVLLSDSTSSVFTTLLSNIHFQSYLQKIFLRNCPRGTTREGQNTPSAAWVAVKIAHYDAKEKNSSNWANLPPTGPTRPAKQQREKNPIQFISHFSMWLEVVWKNDVIGEHHLPRIKAGSKERAEGTQQGKSWRISPHANQGLPTTTGRG